ncbi:MAG: PaaI family thioesterase [Spirochaetia bacterium]|nr:PaaI family thioesterase [Spirochaetia bacterium]
MQPSMTGQDWHSRSCYGCGPDNPHGLQADFRFDEVTGEVRFQFEPKDFMLGAPGFMHGGIIASIMDEAQGVLCFHVGHGVMTEHLDMNYHKATPLDRPFQVRCWITAVRRRRLYTRATIHGADGDLLVSSRATWYALPDRLMERMFAFKAHPEWADKTRATLEANRKRARRSRPA